ncbi:MAG: hypothetical protein IJO13_06740 [Lachnospiraceae bacterium]|nr:hypothetical protein [Lachnospiraceae bacterium]
MEKFGIKEFSGIKNNPACAGNTLLYIEVDLAVWDHPRLCGEYGPEDLALLP